MAKKYKLTQDGPEVQALLNKIDGIRANQTPGQGEEPIQMENLSIDGVLYAFLTTAVSNLLHYYTKSETYTKAEVDSMVAAIKQFTIRSVESLPQPPSADTMNILYLVPAEEPKVENEKDEFITVIKDGSYAWEQIGSTAIDLSGYVTTEALNEALADYVTSEALAAALAVKANANDVYTKQETDAVLDGKADKDGEFPGMLVGSAETIMGKDAKLEEFVFAPLSAADGLAKLNSARGKSLVWNQLAKNGNFADGTTNWSALNGTISASNGIVSFTCNSVPVDTYSLRVTQTFASLKHKYLIRYEIKPAHDTKTQATLYDNPTSVNISGGVWNRASFILANSGEGTRLSLWLDVNKTSAVDDVTRVRNITLIDLTLMFGAGNEPTSVEEFEAMFPLPYYDYNAGEIISNKTEEVKVTGFNQWDEEWEVGAVSVNGGLIYSTNRIRPKNYIPVFPNTEYNFYCGGFTTGSVNVIFYKKRGDTASIGYDTIYPNGSKTFTTPANCHFLKFSFEDTVGYGNTYKNDICINLSDPARNGEYEPYKTNTIELNLPTLTGKLNGEGEPVVVFPDGLKSAGSVYDEIVGNKAIKRVGVVDLGSLSWEANSSLILTKSFVGVIRPSTGNLVVGNILSSKYIAVYWNNASVDKIVAVNTAGWIRVSDSAHSTPPTAQDNWLSGVLLYYELATPEEYILDEPIPGLFQAYNGGTLKQIPENTSVPVTAPMVMEATYSVDVLSKIKPEIFWVEYGVTTAAQIEAALDAGKLPVCKNGPVTMPFFTK